MRKANADCAAGKISGQERLMIHRMLVPDDEWSPHPGTPTPESVRLPTVYTPIYESR